MHDAIPDLDDPRLPAEFLSPHPIGEHSDPRPQRGKAQIAELHLDDLDPQHVADFRPAYLDRSGRAIDERESDVRLGQLLSEMADRAVIGVDRALHSEGSAGRDATGERMMAGHAAFAGAHLAA